MSPVIPFRSGRRHGDARTGYRKCRRDHDRDTSPRFDDAGTAFIRRSGSTSDRPLSPAAPGPFGPIRPETPRGSAQPFLAPSPDALHPADDCAFPEPASRPRHRRTRRPAKRVTGFAAVHPRRIRRAARAPYAAPSIRPPGPFRPPLGTVRRGIRPSRVGRRPPRTAPHRGRGPGSPPVSRRSRGPGWRAAPRSAGRPEPSASRGRPVRPPLPPPRFRRRPARAPARSRPPIRRAAAVRSATA